MLLLRLLLLVLSLVLTCTSPGQQTVDVFGTVSSLRAAMGRLFSDGSPHQPQLRQRWEAQMGRDNIVEVRGPTATHLERPRGFASVEMSEEQTERDWREMCEISSTRYKFLDTVHVSAMAHALCRPILMVASPMLVDPWGAAISPVHFHGLYLPLERNPNVCSKQPLVLCFQDAHFMPCVPTARSSDRDPVLLPLTMKVRNHRAFTEEHIGIPAVNSLSNPCC